jgi:hypothetical protein
LLSERSARIKRPEMSFKKAGRGKPGREHQCWIWAFLELGLTWLRSGHSMTGPNEDSTIDQRASGISFIR